MGILKRVTQKRKYTKKSRGRKLTKQGAKFAAQVDIDINDQVIKDLPDQLRRTVLTEAAEAAGQIVLQEYAANIRPHRDSGFLEEHLESKTIYYESTGITFHVVGPEARAFYAYFLEYGTVKQPPRPYFRQAIDNTMRRQQVVIRAIVKRGAMDV